MIFIRKKIIEFIIPCSFQFSERVRSAAAVCQLTVNLRSLLETRVAQQVSCRAGRSSAPRPHGFLLRGLPSSRVFFMNIRRAQQVSCKNVKLKSCVRLQKRLENSRRRQHCRVHRCKHRVRAPSCKQKSLTYPDLEMVQDIRVETARLSSGL